MPIYWKAVDGTASGVVPGADEGIHGYNLGNEPGEPGEPGLPADINEPIDLLGSEKPANPWRVKVTRYLGASSYDLMRHDECCGGFTALEHLKDFAQLLRNDLARGLAMTTATKEEYRRIIAAIDEVSE